MLIVPNLIQELNTLEARRLPQIKFDDATSAASGFD